MVFVDVPVMCCLKTIIYLLFPLKRLVHWFSGCEVEVIWTDDNTQTLSML
jgi:nitrate reductase gamma subunit